MTSMTYTYDALNRPVSATDAEGNTTRYAYDAFGNLTTVTDPGGNTTTHEYAPGGRHLKTIYPGGSSITYTYDAAGRVKTRQHSNGYTLTYTHDSLGRITEVTSSRNQKKTYTYDPMGNVTAATDANGNTTTYTYTMSGKLATVTDPMGNTTEYTYDPLDNLLTITQKRTDRQTGETDRAQTEEHHTTVYERDPFGRVTGTTDPLGRTEHFRYDALGRPVWKKDRDGNETTTAYTMTGQTAGIRYADGTAVEMQYDALNRLTKVKDSFGTTRIKRDRTGRITAVTGHNGQTVSYAWEKTGQRRRTTYPDGQQTAYTYDSLLRLTAMHIRKQEDGTQHDRNSAEDLQTITYQYDPEGRLTEKVFPDGIRTTWQYDREDGLPVSLTHTDQNGVLDRYTYAYDPMGNKTAVTRQRRGLPRESGAYTYTYDPLGRLTAVAKDGTPLRDYAYDPFSNRAHMTDHRKGSATAYTYDAADRLTMAQTWTTRTDPVQQGTDSPMPDTVTAPLTQPVLTRTYEYDHRGNLTKELQDGIPVHTYAYNAMDRLEKAWSHTPDGAVQTETAYHYNGLGQRVGKSRYTGAAGQTTGIMGQPADSMTAAFREDYLPDLTRPYHNLLSVTRNDGAPAQTLYGDSNAAVMEENGTFHYYLQDEMGSPIRVSGYDSTDTMADGDHDSTDTYLTYGYDEFGNDLARTIGKELEEDGIPSPYTMQGEGQPFGYTGYRYDMDSATYFAQAREYQPQTGRFCAQDVVAGNGAVPVTLNRYGYCLGNPVGMVDLNGKEPIDSLDIAVENLQYISFNMKELKRKKYFIDVNDYDVTTRTDLIEFIKYAEKFEPTLSVHGTDNDGNEIKIIGYGHNATARGELEKYDGVTLTEKQAEELLLQDLEGAVPKDWLLYMNEGANFTAYEIDALTSLSFAMGGNKLNQDSSPNLTRLIMQGGYTWQRMYDEFLTYDASKEDAEGYLKRHAAEAKIFLFGTYDMTFYEKEFNECLE